MSRASSHQNATVLAMIQLKKMIHLALSNNHSLTQINNLNKISLNVNVFDLPKILINKKKTELKFFLATNGYSNLIYVILYV